MAAPLRTSRVLLASALAAAGLLVVGWFDYAATRRDLLQLLREQAVTLRHTIAAAARANQTAGAQAEAQIQERLLDNARLLAELDRQRRPRPGVPRQHCQPGTGSFASPCSTGTARASTRAVERGQASAPAGAASRRQACCNG